MKKTLQGEGKMKKVVLILLSVTMLLVSCAKQTTVTTEQTDSHTENTTEPTETTGDVNPTEGNTEPSVDSSEAIEPPAEAMGDGDVAPGANDAIGSALKPFAPTIIGEFETIEDAFGGIAVSSLENQEGFKDWNDFWEKYQAEHSIGHKEGFYIDGKTDAGILVEIVKNDGDGKGRAKIQAVYAFNTLYDISPTTDGWVYKEFGKSEYPIHIADDIAVTITYNSVSFWHSDGGGSLLSNMNTNDGFGYDAYVKDGVMHYIRFRDVTCIQSLWDWGIERWHSGYGEELAVEYGTVEVTDGKIVFSPTETYSIEEWLFQKLHVKEQMEKAGFDSLDEYMDAYLYGELNPYKSL